MYFVERASKHVPLILNEITEWFSDIALSTFVRILVSKQQIIFGHISDIGNMFSNIK